MYNNNSTRFSCIRSVVRFFRRPRKVRTIAMKQLYIEKLNNKNIVEQRCRGSEH